MPPAERKKITRSRFGCRRCKKLKVKCLEEKPSCSTCVKAGVKCDYSIKLIWGGRPYKDKQKRQSMQNPKVWSQLNDFSMQKLSSTDTTTNSIVDSGLDDAESQTNSLTPSVKKESELDPCLDPESDLSSNSYIKADVEDGTASSMAQNFDSPQSSWYGDNKHQDVLNKMFLKRKSHHPLATPTSISAGPTSSTIAGTTPLVSVSVADDPTVPIVPTTSISTTDTSRPETTTHANHTTAPSPRLGSSNSLLSFFLANQGHDEHRVYDTPSPFALPDHSPVLSSAAEALLPLQQEAKLVDLRDNYAGDLAKIKDAFPTENKSPYFQDFFASPSLRSSPEPEEVDLGHIDSLSELRGSHEPALSSQGSRRSSKSDDFWDPQNALFSIPPQISPLPEILLKVPYYRQLFHFWINVATDNLVPAPYLYKDNPFKIDLPQMAMHYSGLLTTILAFAARARDILDGDGSHQKIVDQLLGRSCNELLKQLQNKSEATSDGTLATSLLLSCYEVCYSNDFKKHRTHTTGASQIVVARYKNSHLQSKSDPTSAADDTGSVSSSSTSKSSDIGSFLTRWFLYGDVLGALSSFRDRHKYLGAFRQDKYKPVEEIPGFDFNESKTRDIDYLLGFDARLLPHFINISLLLDEVEKYMVDPHSDKTCVPQWIVNAALELQKKFLESYQDGEAKREVLFEEKIERNDKVPHMAARQKNSNALLVHDNTLRSTNRLYYDAGLLNLYRRVLLLPRSSYLVQSLIDEMTEVFELGFKSCSPAQICTIFCLFCAGCDTLNEEKKAFYVSRFNDLAQQGHISAAKSLIIMNRCWETGQDWITVANELDIDMVLM